MLISNTYTKIPDLKAISGYKEETSFSRFALKETYSPDRNCKGV